jgi:N6-adenosine-specific RNA methylase IME4
MRKTMPKAPDFPSKEYNIIYADPPWPYYGSTTKNAAAGKHYDLMSKEQIYNLPVKDIAAKDSILFLWATGPKLDLAMETIERWGFHFRGVAFNWIKTRKDGGVIGAQGVPPTVTKPTSELVLVGTSCKRGRPLPIQSSKVPQVLLAERGRHSAKPEEIRQRIDELYDKDYSRIELFARVSAQNWDAWGLEAPEKE